MFSSVVFLELIKLEGAKDTKALIPKYTVAVLIIPIPQPATDLDMVDDYEQLLYIL
ncbi:hypothetical protein [Nostoc sp.]|uniref:hypothetical protein n=1 Tax=Nostoc sp. TaxID=1180 RepID=UPI002FF4FEF1|nr:hypothetical protein [Nostoc sp. NMS9]